MKDTGFNTVWLVNPWATFDPKPLASPHVYNNQAFSDLKQRLDLLRSNGMKAIIGLNYLGKGWSPEGIVHSSWTADLTMYKAFETYAQYFLTQLNGYEDMVYILLFTENSEPYDWAKNPPPLGLAPLLQATIGSFPKRLPPALRTKFRIGYHDYSLINLDWAGAQTPTHNPLSFDFLSMVAYGFEPFDQARITTELNWRIANFRNHYPDTPLIIGELGGKECAPYTDQTQSKTVLPIVAYAVNKPMGFNLWQWKSWPDPYECQEGNPGLGIHHADGITPRPVVTGLKSILNSVTPTVTIRNLSSLGHDTSFIVGDNWQITLTGPPNQPVTWTGTHDGSSVGGSPGQTNANGSFVLTGSMSTTDLGQWSQTWAVGGVAVAPFTFTVHALLSPAAPTMATISTITLSADWTPVAGAQGYIVQLAYDSDFTLPVVSYNGVDIGVSPSATLTNLFPGTPYFLRVMAYNGAAKSAYSPSSPASTFDYQLSQAWSGPLGQVSQTASVARLSVGGSPIAPFFLALNSNPIVSYSPRDWSTFDYELGLATQKGTPIVSVFISAFKAPDLDELAQHLQAHPNVLVIPRFYVFAADLGEADAADPEYRLSLQGNGLSHPSVRTLSAAWIAQAKAMMNQVLDGMNARLPGRIAGVHVGYLDSGEWFSNPCYWNGTNCNGPGTPYFPDYSEDAKHSFCQWASEQGLPECTAPTPTQRSQPGYGNVFVAGSMDADRASAFNRFHSDRVADAIAALSHEAKRLTQGKALTLISYGYLYALNELGISGVSGNLSAVKLLKNPDIDVLVSPYNYTLGRHVGNPLFPQGPMDSPAVYNKLWLFEGDTRTHLCQISQTCGSDGFDDPSSMSNTLTLLRRNILTAGLHNAGMYFFDLGGFNNQGKLVLGGWFGNPADPSNSEVIWDAMNQSIAQVAKIDTSIADAYEPQVAIFSDEASLSVLPLYPTAVEAHAFLDFEKSLVSGIAQNLAQAGVPVRHYYLSDLLSGSIPTANLKMVVFANTFKMSSAIRQAIAQKLHHSNRTLVDDVPSRVEILKLPSETAA